MCRLPHSSSALQALASLTPPSPVLSPSQLPVSWTSGDIPILFIGSPTGDSFAFDGTLPSSTSGDVLDSLKSSDSAGTVETMCTFGPLRSKPGQGNGPEPWSPAPSSPVCTSDNGPSICSSYRSTSISTQITLPALHQSGRTIQQPLPHCESVPVFRATASPPSINLAARDSYAAPEEDGSGYGQYLNYIPPSQTFSALSSPSFALPSPSPSVDQSLSCPSSPRFRRHFGRPFLHEPRQQSVSPRREQTTSMLPNSAPPSPMAPSFSTTARHCRTETSASQSYIKRPISPVDTAASSNSVDLPKSLSWLRDVSVEVYVDQEGFRAIQPSFRLTGYSSQFRFSTQHAGSTPDSAVAVGDALEFMPVKREAFLFHYAPFDGQPVLRRVTVNKDESRDYVSRQASLALKSNGVYSIRGTETSSLSGSSAGHGSDPVKLKWKFDYMVDDRRAEATGRIMDGEKTFTPLTFSCSPALLHALQGKKITLMHVVRKSFIPNLTAEKLEPPKYMMRSILSMSNMKTNIQTTTSKYFAKPHTWNKHRRAASQAVRHEDEENLITRVAGGRKLKGSGGPVLAKGQLSDVQQPRRRRASSAGEQNRRNPDGGAVEHGGTPRFSYLKPIVPRSRLCELLSENMNEAAQTTPWYQPGLQALTPRNHIHR